MTKEDKGFWEKLGERRFAPGAGVAGPPPESGWRRVFFILTTHFGKLISLNLLLLAFSIPVVTIPAALCGMNRVLIKLYRDGNCFVWSEFWKEFRANIGKALPFGLLGGAVMFAAYYFLSWSTSVSADRIEPISAAIGILLLAFAVLFLNYVFVFLPTLDLTSGQIARNAFIFTVTEWKTNWVILACVVILSLATAAAFPYSLLPLVFLTFALQQFFICAAVNVPLQRRIIGPAESSGPAA